PRHDLLRAGRMAGAGDPVPLPGARLRPEPGRVRVRARELHADRAVLPGDAVLRMAGRMHLPRERLLHVRDEGRDLQRRGGRVPDGAGAGRVVLDRGGRVARYVPGRYVGGGPWTVPFSS